MLSQLYNKIIGVLTLPFTHLYSKKEKGSAMDSNLAQDAINKALAGDWKTAVAINEKILSNDPKDIDALNRLGRAYAELGNFKRASKIAQKVLKIDPFNSIASKALEKWKALKKGDTYISQPSAPQTFLEEPGKTKMVSLLHLGSEKVLAKLDAGDEVKLNTHSHRISITTPDGSYIGRIPDDLSARLKKLSSLGNGYQVFIKSIDKGDVKVFIKEVKRGPKVASIPSFSTEKIDYVSFTPPELVHKKEEIDLGVEVEED